MAKASYYSMPLPAEAIASASTKGLDFKDTATRPQRKPGPAQNDLSRNEQHAEGHGGNPTAKQNRPELYAVGWPKPAQQRPIAGWISGEASETCSPTHRCAENFQTKFCRWRQSQPQVRTNTFMGTYPCAQGWRSGSHQRVQLPGLGYAGKIAVNFTGRHAGDCQNPQRSPVT